MLVIELVILWKLEKYKCNILNTSNMQKSYRNSSIYQKVNRVVFTPERICRPFWCIRNSCLQKFIIMHGIDWFEILSFNPKLMWKGGLWGKVIFLMQFLNWDVVHITKYIHSVVCNHLQYLITERFPPPPKETTYLLAITPPISPPSFPGNQ